jgi:hypothetical protein
MEVKLHMFSEKGLQIKENYLMNISENSLKEKILNFKSKIKMTNYFQYDINKIFLKNKENDEEFNVVYNSNLVQNYPDKLEVMVDDGLFINIYFYHLDGLYILIFYILKYLF